MGIERIVMKYIEYPEGATPLDYEESKGLLLTHIATQGELDFWEAKNIDQAMLWADKLKHRDLLNTDFICKLHKKMFSTDPFSWGGAYLKYSNETKQKYLAALRLADKDNLDYSLLLEFVRS